MKKNLTWLTMTLLLAALPLLAGCEQKEESGPGPAEQVGRQIDKAVREASRQTQEMKKRVGEELEQAGKAMQKSDRPAER
jgi:hypothetical protein